jgi:alanine racemase
LTLSESGRCAARIDTEAIASNTRALVSAAGRRALVADVRADGHGHGAVQTALIALDAGAAWLSVRTTRDTVPLRDAGIRAPILVSLHESDGALAESLGVTFRDSGHALPQFYEPGIALYGLGSPARELGLTAAMRVSARVLIVKEIERGDGVSYGYTYRAPARTGVAMVAIGYADGLDRAAGNVASMLLAGEARPIVGRVAMNAAVVEIGQHSVAPGDEAVLFGTAGEPSANEWSTALGISEDEAVTNFGRSLHRIYA